MFGQMQTGAPMQGGAGKGGIQQPMGGGGKGGMNRGPGGNAQNNPGRHQFAQLGQQFNGLGSAGPIQSFPGQQVAQQGPAGNPMAKFQSMMAGFDQSKVPGWGALNTYGGIGSGGAPMPSFQFNKPAFGGGLDTSGMTPISANLTPPTPQPQEPIGGYINGQPAQWHYQAEALKKPAVNNVGLPAGGLLARLYGGG